MREWGLPSEGELERVVVVSPHLDDAVLGCGNFLAARPGATVVTVFAGNPPAYPDPMRKWDVQGGFAPGDDVMEVRRAEDRAALAVLDATPVHLDNVEYTYNPGDRPTSPEQLVESLAPALATLRPTLVLAPFGLANPDHDVTHRACLLARDRVGADVSWWCYEDMGYKHIPGMLAWRISKLFRSDFWPTPMIVPTVQDHVRKRAAIECYRSQLGPLNADHALAARIDGSVPEQFWILAPPPPGWERMREL
jgi:LmbE family N-acetylglucosaminyl deacetylase